MKILIVDDSQAMRKIIKWNLRHSKITHHKFFEASSNYDAQQIIELKNPDLVICDWNLPEMGGIQLLKALRDSNNHVKFGFVVTQMSSSAHNIAMETGADFIISNPTMLKEFNMQASQTL